MSSILDKPIVLSLNRAWQAIAHRTVRQALVAMTGGGQGMAPALAMSISYARLPDGSWDFARPEYMSPVSWEEWLRLPIRDFDMVVTTPRTTIRVPTVIISTQYDKMPTRQPRFSREAVFQRDGGVCQYTGKFVGRDGGNLEHIIPRDQGGRDAWDNCVWSAVAVNSAKANRTPAQAGLTLIRQPRAPMPLPVIATLNRTGQRDWQHFFR